MVKKKNIIFYTIYEDVGDDLKLITQFNTLDEISEHLKMKKKTIKNMIYLKQRIKDKYIIYRDAINEKDLI